MHSTFHQHLQSRQPISLQVDPEPRERAEQTDMLTPYVGVPTNTSATLLSSEKLMCRKLSAMTIHTYGMQYTSLTSPTVAAAATETALVAAVIEVQLNSEPRVNTVYVI